MLSSSKLKLSKEKICDDKGRKSPLEELSQVKSNFLAKTKKDTSKEKSTTQRDKSLEKVAKATLGEFSSIKSKITQKDTKPSDADKGRKSPIDKLIGEGFKQSKEAFVAQRDRSLEKVAKATREEFSNIKSKILPKDTKESEAEKGRKSPIEDLAKLKAKFTPKEKIVSKDTMKSDAEKERKSPIEDLANLTKNFTSKDKNTKESDAGKGRKSPIEELSNLKAKLISKEKKDQENKAKAQKQAKEVKSTNKERSAQSKEKKSLSEGKKSEPGGKMALQDLSSFKFGSLTREGNVVEKKESGKNSQLKQTEHMSGTTDKPATVETRSLKAKFLAREKKVKLNESDVKKSGVSEKRSMSTKLEIGNLKNRFLSKDKKKQTEKNSQVKKETRSQSARVQDRVEKKAKEELNKIKTRFLSRDRKPETIIESSDIKEKSDTGVDIKAKEVIKTEKSFLKMKKSSTVDSHESEKVSEPQENEKKISVKQKITITATESAAKQVGTGVIKPSEPSVASKYRMFESQPESSTLQNLRREDKEAEEATELIMKFGNSKKGDLHKLIDDKKKSARVTVDSYIL